MKKKQLYIVILLAVAVGAVLFFNNFPPDSIEGSVKNATTTKKTSTTRDMTTQVQTNNPNPVDTEAYGDSSGCFGACSTGLQACNSTNTPSAVCDQRFNDCSDRCNERYIDEGEVQ